MDLYKSLSPTTRSITAGIFGFMIMVSACAPDDESKEPQPEDHAFAAPVEKAHNMKQWKSKGALKADIELSFGGDSRLDATLFVEAGGPGIRLELSGDTVAVFDGSEMWASPSDSAVTPFDLKTWAYFLKAPYKLNDPGTRMGSEGAANMKGRSYDTARLTFASGTGDTPDDWYVLYRNPETNRLQAMAYIVTAGKTVEEANKDPHAISYDNFEMIDGIAIAASWKFWGWDIAKGFSDEIIGEAQLGNIEFVEKGQLFAKPAAAVQMKR